eukprot:CAMPEP_0181293718 /NCGR_PEP_ID=MMETSP1101-20121128/3212_1 /TAXON_ID=46948 /ORGANISM="Rhodomonas abbreviata, Strain Caron Lab Isolate" /LENGTH=194 /DNA_ID=CAMNT_0023398319 /DNA_START=171 /DNA_END=756 /DNA_ORIENTATION=-
MNADVDVESFAQMGARLPVGESVVFFSIIAVFLALRLRTESAIKTREARIDAESALRAAKTASVSGEDGASEEVARAQERLDSLAAEEEAETLCVQLMTIPNTNFRLRLPPPPRDADDIARERVMKSRQAETKPSKQQEEERLPQWQEIAIVVSLTALLAPFLLLAVVDPISKPSPALQAELQLDPSAPPSRPR